MDPSILPSAEAPPAYHIASVGRALTLLTAFVERPELTVSQAADLLDVAPSTAHRLLQMLVFHRFIDQDEHRVYVRGPALTSLSRVPVAHPSVDSIVGPYLARLRDEFKGTAHLLRLEGNGARFVAAAGWRDERQIAISRVGWLLPAHTLAGGKVMLARLSPSHLETLYPDGLPVTRYAPISSLAQLRAELRDIRLRGFATSQEAHESISALGVSVPGPGRKDLMALSIAWSDPLYARRHTEGIVEAMRESAEAVSGALAERSHHDGIGPLPTVNDPA